MGWNSAGDIFDPVAKAMIDLNAPDEMKRKVLGALIGQLQEGDWDTEDESLEQFKNDPAIVDAFRDNDVIRECGYKGDENRWCELEREHDGMHQDEDGETWES